MRKRIKVGVVLAGLTLAGLTACQQNDDKAAAAPASQPETLQQKISYAVGLDIGTNFRQSGFELDGPMLLLGFEDARQKSDPRLTEEEMNDAIRTFQQQMVAQFEERQKALAQEQTDKAKAFLAEHRQKPGVQETASGLQYLVERDGEGRQPGATDQVKVHYSGRTIDGTEFDSSYQRGEPVTFPLDAVIPGWSEALQLMREGAKWQLVLPAELAYGEEGRGEIIPPNAALIFDVELLEVLGEDADAPASQDSPN
ncbi:MAG: FKBP-type peptidyl-prolyl cis-trans isomerase [Desulfuromonas thiophila]|nr:FKBP-type peptidyl-prolyl cis-trans isomerase [Desulfuromonas thiophila]